MTAARRTARGRAHDAAPGRGRTGQPGEALGHLGPAALLPREGRDLVLLVVDDGDRREVGVVGVVAIGAEGVDEVAQHAHPRRAELAGAGATSLEPLEVGMLAQHESQAGRRASARPGDVESVSSRLNGPASGRSPDVGPALEVSSTAEALECRGTARQGVPHATDPASAAAAAATAPATGRDDLAGPPRGGAGLVCGAHAVPVGIPGGVLAGVARHHGPAPRPACCRCWRTDVGTRRRAVPASASSRRPRRSARESASSSGRVVPHLEPGTDRQIAGALWVAADDLPSMPAHQRDVARFLLQCWLLPRAHRAHRIPLLVEALRAEDHPGVEPGP